jgi:ribokinase
MEENQYDFVAIGDITTDAFIFLKDAEVHCSVDNEKCELCVRFGDKIPYEKVEVIRAVGNSANAAVSAAKLGLKSAFVGNVGDDQNGKECIETLGSKGVATEFLKTESGKETNYHYVLQYGAERTILVKHHDYEYSLPSFATPPRYMYLSSLGEHSLPFHEEIGAYVEAHPETRLVFQPGTFQIKTGAKTFTKIYESTYLFVCNREEAMQILGTTDSEISKLLSGIQALGPEIVAITDGPKGAYLLAEGEKWFMPIYPDPAAPISRTGAGDAFASTFTSMLAFGKSVHDAFRIAPINSMNVVQHIGAQAGLLSLSEVEAFLEKAPGDYEPQTF